MNNLPGVCILSMVTVKEVCMFILFSQTFVDEATHSEQLIIKLHKQNGS